MSKQHGASRLLLESGRMQFASVPASPISQQSTAEEIVARGAGRRRWTGPLRNSQRACRPERGVKGRAVGRDQASVRSLRSSARSASPEPGH